MTARHRPWHLRVAFEPNRFSSAQLITVYEQLKPTKSRTTATESLRRPERAKRPGARRGGQ
jgi:hypothetical protein